MLRPNIHLVRVSKPYLLRSSARPLYFDFFGRPDNSFNQEKMISETNGDEEFSGSDADDGFEEDLEALRRACMLTGTDPKDLRPSFASASASAADNPPGTFFPAATAYSDAEEDDLELIRGIQERYSACTQAEMPLFLEPLSTLPPPDEDEDDFETLRAIQRRFSGYGEDSVKNCKENYLNNLEQVHATSIALEKETSFDLVADRTIVSEEFPNSFDVHNSSHNPVSFNEVTPGDMPSSLIEWHHTENHNLAISPLRGSGFPKSAQMFVDAIKKNRMCQKFIRSKLVQIEARIEENKKLKQRVKILKDFQVTCKKRTGRALSQKQDARVQLISARKRSSNSKVNGKNISALYSGPDENSHVASYRMVLAKYPTSLSREKWSSKEREGLAKGIKQQFQELLLQESVDLISDVEGSSSNNFDSMITSIRDLDIPPETVRSFLPKVNWERLASMYVTNHSAAECEARWLNYEDPLINHKLWSKMEDKDLLRIIQETRSGNWIDIAVSLRTNRTPSRCLARYQRSLNPFTMKREWTEEEDDKLRAAVETFGESNWQHVASTLEGRTGTQCSNRWIKSLHPTRQRVGRWDPDEDRRLKVAVMLFGPRSWRKIAQFVHGRTHVQCRERWFNCLDPALNLGEWSEEEDLRLEAAIKDHGHCWSKVAACVPPRTDNQCRRRWKLLFPDEVSLLQEERNIQKMALMSNFVDRESERPTLGPNDFVRPALTNTVPEPENVNSSGKQKRKSRRSSRSKSDEKVSRSNRPMKEAQICPGEVLMLKSGKEVEIVGGDNATTKKRVMKPRVMKKKGPEPTQDMRRNGQEFRPCDGGTKRRSSSRMQERRLRTMPGTDVIGMPSRSDAISKKERGKKRLLKEAKVTGPTSALLSDCADSAITISHVEEVREFGVADASKRKKSFKPRRRNSNHVKVLDDILGVNNLDGAVNFGEYDKKKRISFQHLNPDKPTDLYQVCSSSYPNLTSLRTTDVGEADALDDDGARKKNCVKLRSRDIRCSKLMQELAGTTGCSEVDTLGGISDVAVLRKKKRRANINNLPSKSFTINKDRDEIFGGNGANVGFETIAGDDDTALGRKKRARNGHPRRRKCFKQLGKHQDLSASCADVAAESQSKQYEITKLVASPGTSFTQNCSTHVYSDEENSRASADCPQVRLKKRSRTRENTSDNVLEAEDGDDTTLASFIENIRKKRRLNKLARKGNDYSHPKSMEEFDLLHDKNVGDCTIGRNVPISSQASQSHQSENLPPGDMAGEIDCGKSHLVEGGEASSIHGRFEEPPNNDLGGFREADDDNLCDTSSPPPGFENPIYCGSESEVGTKIKGRLLTREFPPVQYLAN